MNFHFRRESSFIKRAPPLGHFLTRNEIMTAHELLANGYYADAQLVLCQWLDRTPRMPTKAEEARIADG